MHIINLIFFFILGLIMGEIYTIIGTRLPNEEEKLNERSHCDICFHKLNFYEIIPIFSYILLKGKCSYCHKKINIKNPLMELFTAILFTLSYYRFGFSYELLIAIGIISLLMIITVSDINYLIIPDEVLIFFIGYFLIIQSINLNILELLKHILSGTLLFTLMYLVMIIGNKVFKKESLGGGDIKLMFLFGLILEPFMGLITLFLGSLLALPISILLLYKNKEKLIPFGPFLVLALTLIYFININTITLLNLLGIY